jgi:hypothetical protein
LINMTMKNETPHPLAALVWKAIEERSTVDTSTIAYELAGAIVKGGRKAYRTVARDVLGYMHDQGLLIIDEQGWYRKAPKQEEGGGEPL